MGPNTWELQSESGYPQNPQPLERQNIPPKHEKTKNNTIKDALLFWTQLLYQAPKHPKLYPFISNDYATSWGRRVVRRTCRSWISTSVLGRGSGTEAVWYSMCSPTSLNCCQEFWTEDEEKDVEICGIHWFHGLWLLAQLSLCCCWVRAYVTTFPGPNPCCEHFFWKSIGMEAALSDSDLDSGFDTRHGVVGWLCKELTDFRCISRFLKADTWAMTTQGTASIDTSLNLRCFSIKAYFDRLISSGIFDSKNQSLKNNKQSWKKKTISNLNVYTVSVFPTPRKEKKSSIHIWSARQPFALSADPF